VAWWWWVLLWIGLLAGAAGVFALIGRSLWRKAVALVRELGTAADRLGAVSAGLQQLAATQTDEPAVFTSASQLRQDRILAGRRDDGRRTPGPDAGHPTRGSQKPRQSVR
jgi:hypothetical protein